MEKPKYTGINRIAQSEALQQLIDIIHYGTFSDFVKDWKWIFTFSKKYKWIIVLYTVVGILGSTLGIGSAYVGRTLINIIVDKQTEKLWLLVAIMLGSVAFSLVMSSVSSRIFTKISIYVNNDIQAAIFDRIIDAKWSDLSKYPSGDLLNRFNGDVGTIAGNALDLETEERVLQNIIKRHPAKVIIVSTHRPGALKLCQKLYRLSENGVESVSYEEAVQASVMYYDMAQTARASVPDPRAFMPKQDTKEQKVELLISDPTENMWGI